MDQKEINQAEWMNPRNWRTGFYFSKKDARVATPSFNKADHGRNATNEAPNT
jgi:hypothetical protein